MARSSQTGNACRRARVFRRSARGFTFLWVLLAVAFLGIALAAVGTMWATVAQRDREAQLLFVGDAYRNAIASYYNSGPVAHQLPRDLEDLVDDRRLPQPRRHLRRLYADPMTGRTDWQLSRDPDGGIFGVSSTSQRAPFKRSNFSAQDGQFEGTECLCDWKFEFTPSRAAVKRRR